MSHGEALQSRLAGRPLEPDCPSFAYPKSEPVIWDLPCAWFQARIHDADAAQRRLCLGAIFPQNANACTHRYLNIPLVVVFADVNPRPKV